MSGCGDACIELSSSGVVRSPVRQFCTSVRPRGTMDTGGNECWAYGDLARFCWLEAGRAAVGACFDAYFPGTSPTSTELCLIASTMATCFVHPPLLGEYFYAGEGYWIHLPSEWGRLEHWDWLGFDWDLWLPLPARRPSNGSGFPLECLSGMWHPPSVFERGGFSHLIWQPIVRRTLTFPLISERRL